MSSGRFGRRRAASTNRRIVDARRVSLGTTHRLTTIRSCCNQTSRGRLVDVVSSFVAVVTPRSAAAMPSPFPERPFGVVDAAAYALEGMYMPNPGEFEPPKLAYDDSNAVRARLATISTTIAPPRIRD